MQEYKRGQENFQTDDIDRRASCSWCEAASSIMTAKKLLLLNSYKKARCRSAFSSSEFLPGDLVHTALVQSRNKILIFQNKTMRPLVVVSMMFTVVMINTMLAAAAVQHKVGGTLGWNYPPNQGPEFFATWAAQNEFHVGDSLSFEYVAGTHNVVQVDHSDYEACTSNRPMQLYSADKVVVNLSKPGTYYYICGIRGHCEYGMKVALTVT